MDKVKLHTIVLFILTIPSHGEVLHVSQSGSGLDGSSWMDAFMRIGDAIEAATSGDQIWVASGAYNEFVSIQHLSSIGIYCPVELMPQQFFLKFVW